METSLYIYIAVSGLAVGILLGWAETARFLFVNRIDFSELNKLATDKGLTVSVKKHWFLRYALIAFDGNRYFSRYRSNDKLDDRIEAIHSRNWM